jgi:hypothetical protein
MHYCKVCNYTAFTSTNIKIHYNSKKHINNMICDNIIQSEDIIKNTNSINNLNTNNDLIIWIIFEGYNGSMHIWEL